MENGGSEVSRTPSREKALGELMQGQMMVAQLLKVINPNSSTVNSFAGGEGVNMLVKNIMSCISNAISALTYNGSIGSGHVVVQGNANGSESPRSMSSSPRSGGDSDRDNSQKVTRRDDQQERRDMSKKRKTLPKWTEHARASSEGGPEGALDDGYSWRKYGQKDILGAKYPRGYYRCTHRHVQGCQATKHVQRSDRNPLVYDITYRGKHTCIQTSQILQALAFPENHQKLHAQLQNMQQQQQQQQPDVLLSFETGRRIKTEHTEPTTISTSFSFPSPSFNHQRHLQQQQQQQEGIEKIMGSSYTPTFVSPTTSESTYCMTSPLTFTAGLSTLQVSESDFNEIISAATSASNSPMFDADLQLEQLDLDSEFPFDVAGFF